MNAQDQRGANSGAASSCYAGLNYTGFLCSKCGEQVEVDEDGKLLKGYVATGRNRTNIRCPGCNTMCTVASKLRLTLPFSTHDTTEAKEFFKNAKGLTSKKMEQYIQNVSRRSEEHRSTTGTAGKYYPLGVYERLGWDPAWIEANCKDYYDQGGIRL